MITFNTQPRAEIQNEYLWKRYKIAENLGRYGAVTSLEPNDDHFSARFFWEYGGSSQKTENKAR